MRNGGMFVDVIMLYRAQAAGKFMLVGYMRSAKKRPLVRLSLLKNC